MAIILSTVAGVASEAATGAGAGVVCAVALVVRAKDNNRPIPTLWTDFILHSTQESVRIVAFLMETLDVRYCFLEPLAIGKVFS